LVILATPVFTPLQGNQCNSGPSSLTKNGSSIQTAQVFRVPHWTSFYLFFFSLAPSRYFFYCYNVGIPHWSHDYSLGRPLVRMIGAGFYRTVCVPCFSPKPCFIYDRRLSPHLDLFDFLDTLMTFFLASPFSDDPRWLIGIVISGCSLPEGFTCLAVFSATPSNNGTGRFFSPPR